MPSSLAIGAGSNEVKEDGDEWTTIQRTTRPRRSQRRRNRNYQGGDNSKPPIGSNGGNTKNASEFFEKAVAATLQSSVQSGDSATPEQIVDALRTCLQELKESQYWDTVRLVLKNRAENHQYQFQSIVCYGIGIFGTKRPSAPMWQLALALMIRDCIGTSTFTATDAQQHSDLAIENENGPVKSLETKTLKQSSPSMYYYEPLMTLQESKVLKQFDIRVIEENERGKRAVNNNNGSGYGDDDNKMNNGATLFFMPHCPLSLYTNVFHTNWDCLRQIIIFGNSLSNYIDGGNTSIVTDPKKQQALQILELLQPHWTVDNLRMNKKDIADRAAYFEQAFNDSSFTCFSTPKITAPDVTATWPERPHLDAPLGFDGGEVL